NKIVYLIKSYPKDRKLVRPRITIFATIVIAIENNVLTAEWETYNNTSKRLSEVENVSCIILDNKFWTRTQEVCSVIKPPVKIL
ncbi:hypothetical protein MIMGU_mgv1a022465mg, partial [Erythranthe guttata]